MSTWSDRVDLILEAGYEYGTSLLDDTYSIAIRRGVRSNGVTDDLEPAFFTAVIKGVSSQFDDQDLPLDLDPRYNDDLRPNRPIRLRGNVSLDFEAAEESWPTIWTGIIQRARVEHDPDAKNDPTAYRLHITGTDLVASLAGIPSEVSVGGNLHQRVAAVMDPTGLPYVVVDPSSAGAAVPLPTDAKDLVGQLRLIRDTAHALSYVDRDGQLVFRADAERPRAITEPDWRATDDAYDYEYGSGYIYYTEIDPAFDTDSVVNVLTIKTLDGVDNPEGVYTDEDSRAAWGDKPQTVTVNDGLAETHAGLYLASRTTPDTVPQNIAFLVQRRLPQANGMRGEVLGHLDAAIGLELYDTIRVTRHVRLSLAALGVHDPDGALGYIEGDVVPTELDLLVMEISHTITPGSWIVRLGLRVPEVLPTRWDDIPADLTWDDVPADLTWDSAVNWHPYLPEGA